MVVCNFRLFETLQSLFWSIFGLISLYVTQVKPDHEFTEFVGTTMFGTYNIISLVVLLNMLIAMMNNSYQHIAVSLIWFIVAAHAVINFLCDISLYVFFPGSCRYRMEICSNQIMDELFRRGGDFAVSVQYNTESEVFLLPNRMGKEASV